MLSLSYQKQGPSSTPLLCDFQDLYPQYSVPCGTTTTITASSNASTGRSPPSLLGHAWQRTKQLASTVLHMQPPQQLLPTAHARDNELVCVQQRLWPDHCVEGSEESGIHPDFGVVVVEECAQASNEAIVPAHISYMMRKEGSELGNRTGSASIISATIKSTNPAPDHCCHCSTSTNNGASTGGHEAAAASAAGGGDCCESHRVLVMRKGRLPHLDAYSMFLDNVQHASGPGHQDGAYLGICAHFKYCMSV